MAPRVIQNNDLCIPDILKQGFYKLVLKRVYLYSLYYSEKEVWACREKKCLTVRTYVAVLVLVNWF